MKLVIVADDYGLCESVNQGIIEAHQNGIVTELSLMLGSPGTDQALDLVKEHNVMNLGIHMLLKNWRDTGALVHRPDYKKLFAELSAGNIAELVARELAEFEQVVGRKPSHITSQYGIIGHPKALSAVVAYAKANHVPLRLPHIGIFTNDPDQLDQGIRLLQENHIVTTDYFFAHVFKDNLVTVKADFEADLSTVHGNETAEICLHPGRVDNNLRKLTSLVDERERDRQLALDPDFKLWIGQRGIKIVGYQEIG